MRLLVVIAGVTVAACANGHVESSAPAEPFAEGYSDVQSFCQALAQVECSDAVVTACAAKSASSCEVATTAGCMTSQPQGTTFVAANAPACVALARTTYAKSTISADEKTQMATVCGVDVFSGPGDVRTPCTTASDCSSALGLTCVIPYAQTSGKCLTPHPVPPNGSCAGEADVCADAAWFCDPKRKQCSARANAGEACQDGFLPCSPGLSCANGLFATCQKKKGDGSPCTFETECAAGLCDKANSQGEGTCAEQITLTPLDAACTQFTGQ